LKRLSVTLIILILAVFLLTGSASASAILELSHGSITQTIYDSSDSDADGVVFFTGSIGSFNINYTTGLTKPVIGSASFPYLDLNSLNVSNGNGTLTIKLTDTGFYLPDTLSGFEGLIGGTTDGTVTADIYLDITNTTFGTGTLLGSFGPFSSGAFSDDFIWTGDPAEPFSLTIVASITQGAGNVTSFDCEISAVPIPATVWILGSGLIGLVGIRRKFRK